MSNNLVIYHTYGSMPCRDGMVAAWVARLALPDCDFLGWQYKQNDAKEYPDVRAYKNIFIVDFHFPREVLEDWTGKGKVIHLIDHHKSTLPEIGDFSNQLGKRFRYEVTECGATLAWKYFFGSTPQPVFLKYILDRDNFYKKLPFTEEVHSGFGKVLWKGDLIRAFELLDQISEMSEQEFLEWIVPIGEPVAEARREKILKIINSRGVQWIKTNGYKVPMISLLKSQEQFRSDIGEVLYRLHTTVPFVVIKKATGGYSLRSDQYGSNFDCTQIPGLQGHANAGSTSSLEYEVLENGF